jgi:hypothetical protein
MVFNAINTRLLFPMGLSLHYEVRFGDGEAARARELVRTLHRRASEYARAKRIEKVLPISEDPEDLDRFAMRWIQQRHPDDPDTICGVAVPAQEGSLFPVVPGEGCEPLWFGLCRYPATVRQDGRDLATRCGQGWRFQSACKTQYASRHGWEHFHRCHTNAILLIRVWAELGGRLRLVDEGGWWPRRSDATLRRKLGEMDGIVAAFAGVMKDAAEDEGGPRIQSPIFAHPQFERLEAEGASRHAAKLDAARKIVTEAARKQRRE